MARSVLKPHAALFAAVLRLCDPLLTIVTGVVAYRLYLEAWDLPDRYLLFLAVGALAVATVFPLFELYAAQRGAGIAEELRRLVYAWLLLAGLTGIATFATKMGDTYSRVWVTAWLAGGFVVTATLRIAIRLGLRALRRRGFNQRHIAVVGAGRLGRTVGARLAGTPWAGFAVRAFYDDDPAKLRGEVGGRAVLPIDDRLRTDVATGDIDQVWIALPLRAEARIRTILDMLRDFPIEIRFVPDIYGFHLLNHSMTDVGGLPVISLTETPMSGINRVLKAIEDYTLAGILLVVATPLLLVIAIGVML